MRSDEVSKGEVGHDCQVGGLLLCLLCMLRSHACTLSQPAACQARAHLWVREVHARSGALRRCHAGWRLSAPTSLSWTGACPSPVSGIHISPSPPPPRAPPLPLCRAGQTQPICTPFHLMPAGTWHIACTACLPCCLS